MSIEKTKNGKYKVRYRDQSKKQRSTTFARKKDAEAFERKVAIEIKNEIWLDPMIAQVLLEDVWEDYFELKQGKKLNTKRDYENVWKLHLAPRWGKVMVGQIEQTDFDKWVISKELSPQRISKIHLLMCMLLDHAVVKKYLRTNPLKDALGKRNKKHLPTPGIEIATNFLSLGELLTLAKECGYYRDVVLVLGLCGLRWGELVGLKAKDLDLQKGTLTIRGALVEVDGRLSESTTKANRWRIVRLPEILRESCGEWIKGKNENDPLFHTETGNFIRNTNFTRRVFLPAIERAGVKKIRIHDLRHTAASIAISAKATPNMVKELLGHADVQLTMRVYAHVFEEDRETVATNIDRAVNEVHEMCTEDLAGIISPPRKATNARSEQDFSFNIHTLDSLRTWDYEFGALTN